MGGSTDRWEWMKSCFHPYTTPEREVLYTMCRAIPDFIPPGARRELRTLWVYLCCCDCCSCRLADLSTLYNLGWGGLELSTG